MRSLLWSLASTGCVAPLEGDLRVEWIRSEALDTRYQYSTYVHPDVPLAADTPLVLLLDGDQAMEPAARALDRGLRRGELAPMVLVGVGHEATRDRDLTTLPTTPPDYGGEWDPDWGGGIEPFFAFVEAEVLPRAEAELGVAGTPERRGLLGHSLGGFATVWAVVNERHVFRHFAASSPSLWWDDAVAFDWEQPDGPPVTVFASVGSVEIPPMNVLFEEWTAEIGRDPGVELNARTFHGHDHFTVAEEMLDEGLADLFPVGAR